MCLPPECTQLQRGPFCRSGNVAGASSPSCKQRSSRCKSLRVGSCGARCCPTRQPASSAEVKSPFASTPTTSPLVYRRGAVQRLAKLTPETFGLLVWPVRVGRMCSTHAKRETWSDTRDKDDPGAAVNNAKVRKTERWMAESTPHSCIDPCALRISRSIPRPNPQPRNPKAASLNPKPSTPKS